MVPTAYFKYHHDGETHVLEWVPPGAITLNSAGDSGSNLGRVERIFQIVDEWYRDDKYN